MDEWLGRMAAWPDRRWAALAAASGVAAGGLGLATVAAVGAGLVAAATAALLGAAGTVGVVLALRHGLGVRRDLDRLRALVNVRPLTRSLPLDLGDWAADPAFADELVRHLLRRRPRRTVECGSGWTTVLMGACLEEIGAGRVVALEHDEHYAERTRELLAHAGCRERAEVRLAPLVRHRIQGEERLWYRLDRMNDFGRPIDLLVVDAPPETVGPAARYPAVPLLGDRLGEESLVILDDGFRGDEEKTARDWGRMLGVEPVLEPRGRGIWLLEGRSGAGEGGPGDSGTT